MDLEVIVTNGYSKIPQIAWTEMQFSVISRTLFLFFWGGSLTDLQRIQGGE